MEKRETQTLISPWLKDISEIDSSNLLFGYYKSSDKNVGVFIIDYNNTPPPSDLQGYQEKYISSIYYNTPGYLQWNYYLIFLRDDYSLSDQQRIEKDSQYTRKFIFNEQELKDYFEYKHSDEEVEQDVVNIWMEKLREVDLDEVYSKEDYTKAITRYLNNEVIKDNEIESIEVNTNENLRIDRISRLELMDSYRKYPLRRQFDLGKVNLISGVNGTGKTSFLEAAELIIAGKSNRDHNNKEENGCIEATYNDQIVDSYTPLNNEKYRKRDNAWYSSSYKKGNELYRAFNKYNFYDSDAAYKLAHDPDPVKLKKYFSDIALGPEYNRIQRRMNGFKTRLESEQKMYIQQIKDVNQDIEQAQEILDSSKNIASPEISFKLLSELLIKVKWQKNIPISHKESFVKFKNDLDLAKNLIASISNSIATFKLSTSADINKEYKKVEALFKTCNSLSKDIEGHEKHIQENKNQLSSYNEELERHEIANKYFKQETSFKLKGLDTKINSLQQTVSIGNRVLDEFTQIKQTEIRNEKTTLQELLNTLNKEKQEITKHINSIGSEINTIKSNLGHLNRIITDIKTLGQEYVETDQDITECPLCKTHYSRNELSIRISQISEKLKSNKLVEDLSKQKRRAELNLNKVTHKIIELGHLEKAINLIVTKSFSKLQVEEIYKKIENYIKENEKRQNELNDNINLRNKLESKGFSENEILELEEYFGEISSNIKFNYSNKITFSNRLNKLREQRETIIKNTKDSVLALTETTNLLENKLHKYDTNVEIANYDKELNFRLSSLESIQVNFKELKSFLKFDETQKLSYLSNSIENIQSLLKNLENSILGFSELRRAKKTIKEGKNTLAKSKPFSVQIEKGLNVLNDLLNNYSEDRVLGDFVNTNANDIQNIFQSIHSPKEFSKISFDEQEIRLEREIDNKFVPLNKISTGQRSALALSIFLALNKKLKHGPNIILMDDPVTYTDDLNVLSFLDYLRQMVIHEDRQIIFATANNKLAGLVEKKFSFLGEEEYKKYALNR